MPDLKSTVVEDLRPGLDNLKDARVIGKRVLNVPAAAGKMLI